MKMFIVILIFIAVALATNPGESDHRAALQTEIYRINGVKEGFLTDVISYAAAKQFMTVKSYYLCSFTTIKGVKVGFGCFGHVWVYTETLTNKL